MPDAINNTFERFEDLAVPEPDDPVAVACEGFGALRVICLGVTMLAAVEFDDEFRCMAGEVSDVSGDGHLAADVAAFGFQETQVLPEKPFSTGGVGAE